MENQVDLFDNYSKEDLLKLLKSQAKANSELEFKATKLESKNEKLELVFIKLEQENSYLKFQI